MQGVSAGGPRRRGPRLPARACPSLSSLSATGSGPEGDAQSDGGTLYSACAIGIACPRARGGAAAGRRKKPAAAAAAGPRTCSPVRIFLSGEWYGSLWGRLRG